MTMETLIETRFNDVELADVGGSSTLAKLGIVKKNALELFKWFMSNVPQKNSSVENDLQHLKCDLRISRLLNILRLRNKPLAFSIFMSLDHTCSHSIRFPEFLLGAWNICTIPKEKLLHFILEYLQNEPIGSAGIKPRTLETVVKLTYTYGRERDSFMETTLKLIRELQVDESIPLAKLEEYSLSKSPALDYLCVGVLQLQTHIRRCILGVEFWEPLIRGRGRRLREEGEIIVDAYRWFCHQNATKESVHRLKNTASTSGVSVVLARVQTPLQSIVESKTDYTNGVRPPDAPKECIFTFVEPTVKEQVVHALAPLSPVVVLGKRCTLPSECDEESVNLPNGQIVRELHHWYKIATDSSGDIEWVPQECIVLHDPCLDSQKMPPERVLNDDGLIYQKLQSIQNQWACALQSSDDGISMAKYWVNLTTGVSVRNDPEKLVRTLMNHS